jgi:hypothetical protein
MAGSWLAGMMGEVYARMHGSGAAAAIEVLVPVYASQLRFGCIR